MIEFDLSGLEPQTFTMFPGFWDVGLRPLQP